MNERLTIQDLTDLLAAKHSMTKKDAEAFVKEFFLLIEEALESEKFVKIKGLGTFKLIDVDSRESVNVNTGERFQIKGHTKVSFTPDASLKDTVNKPFAHFETVVLNDNTVLEDTPLEEGENEEEETYEEVSLEIPENKGEPTEDNFQTEEIPEESAIIKDEEEVIRKPATEEPKSKEVVEEENIVENEQVEEGQKIQKHEPEPTPVVNKPELSAEEIIKQELQKANLRSAIPEINSQITEPQAASNSIKPEKEKSPVAFLVTIIVVVLLLCGGAILFIYYPDLFSPSPKKETLDMPTAIQAIKPEVQLIDTIKKDTVAKITQEAVQPTIKEEVKAPAKQEIKTQPEVSATYSDTATYTITGTKATHTIKEGESLTKVSLRYYGTKALWPYIVKHNPTAIKNPDNVPFGTTIKIPELTKQ